MNQATIATQDMDKTQTQFIDIAHYILQKIKPLALTACEININFSIGSSTTVRLGKLETIAFNQDKTMSIVAYDGLKIGNASTSDLSETTIDQTLAAAKNITKYTQEDSFSGLADAQDMATHFPDLDLYHPWDIDHTQAAEMAIQCEQAGLDYNPLIFNSEGSTVHTYQSLTLSANSHGFIGLRRSSQHSISCSLLAKQGEEMQTDYWYSLSRRSDQLESMIHVGQKAAQRTLARLGSKSIKTGVFPVLFEANIAPSLINHFFNAINGSTLYRDESFLKDQINQTIFPEWLDIYEKPYELQGFGSNSFDNDGLQTREQHFINQGVLSRYLLSVYSGRKLNLPSTANAGGTRNVRITSNQNSLDDLIKEMGTGLLVTELIGSSVNILTGNYSRGASGFWVENGEIQHPVTEVTIASTLQSMFKHIVGVGKDVDLRQSMQTGSILIDHMTVAGK